MNGDFNDRVAANLASLNETVTEIAAKVGESDWAEVVRTVLKEHTHGFGYTFQGQPPYGVDIPIPEAKLRLPGIHADILLERIESGVRLTVIEESTPGQDSFGAEIDLTDHGMDQLVEGLQQVRSARVPGAPRTGSEGPEHPA